MMHRVLSAVLTASATALALTVLPAGPATAQERSVFDPRGDAPASADLTRVTVRNGADAVVVVLKVRDLRRYSDTTIYINHAGPGRYTFRTAGTLNGFLTFGGVKERAVPCEGRRVTRYTGPRSEMVVRIPQRCFGRRAGTAAFNVIMWQARGQGSDRVAAMPITLRRG